MCTNFKTIIHWIYRKYKRCKSRRNHTKIFVSEREERDNIHKILLVGPERSGKSTIFKNILEVYGSEFDEESTTDAANEVYTMKILVEQCFKLGYSRQVKAQDALCLISNLTDIDEEKNSMNELLQAIEDLWQDPAIVKTWDKRRTFLFSTNSNTIHTDLNEIFTHKLIKSKLCISGLRSQQIESEGLVYEIFDVGGHKQHREKWIHCINDVTAVIFIASLNDYNKSSREGNKLAEATKFFAEICSEKRFKNTPIILLLNQRDLFARQIKIQNVSSIEEFQDFGGRTGSFTDSSKYFFDLFLRATKSYNQKVYCHCSCAKDNKHTAKVLNRVFRDIIVHQNIQDSLTVF